MSIIGINTSPITISKTKNLKNNNQKPKDHLQVKGSGELKHSMMLDNKAVLNKAALSFGATFSEDVDNGGKQGAEVCGLYTGVTGALLGAGADTLTMGLTGTAATELCGDVGKFLGETVGYCGGAVLGAGYHVFDKVVRTPYNEAKLKKREIEKEQSKQRRETLEKQAQQLATKQKAIEEKERKTMELMQQNNEKERKALELIQQANEKERMTLEAEQRVIEAKKRFEELLAMHQTQERKEDNGFGLGKLAGYNADKNALYARFIAPFIQSMSKNPPVGIRVPNGVLLSGPSGNGKTTMALALAEEALGEKINTNFYNLSGKEPQEVLKELKDIKEKVMNDFTDLKTKNQRSIVFIDEIDGIIPGPNMGGYNGIINAGFKTLIQNCSKDGLTVIAATNYPQHIEEPFIINNDRFGLKTLIEPPTKEDIQEILKFYLDGLTEEPLNYEALANKIQERVEVGKGAYSCSGLKQIAMDVRENTKNAGHLIRQQDVLQEIETTFPDIGLDNLEKLEKDFDTLKHAKKNLQAT